MHPDYLEPGRRICFDKKQLHLGYVAQILIILSPKSRNRTPGQFHFTNEDIGIQ